MATEDDQVSNQEMQPIKSVSPSLIRRAVRPICILFITAIYGLITSLLAYGLTDAFFFFDRDYFLHSIVVSALFLGISGLGIGISWLYKKPFGRIKNRVIQWIGNSKNRDILWLGNSKNRVIQWLRRLLFPELSVNDPARMEDGWEAGSQTRLRKIIHWIIGLIAVPVAVTAMVWLGFYISYTSSWKRTLAEIEAQGRPVTFEALIGEPIPDEENGALDIDWAVKTLRTAQSNASNSPSASIVDLLNTSDYEYIEKRLNIYWDDILSRHKYDYNDQNNLMNFSSTELLHLFIRIYDQQIYHNFVFDIEKALAKPKFADTLISGQVSWGDYYPQLDINSGISTTAIRRYSFSYYLSNNEMTGFRSLLIAIRVNDIVLYKQNQMLILSQRHHKNRYGLFKTIEAVNYRYGFKTTQINELLPLIKYSINEIINNATNSGCVNCRSLHDYWKTQCGKLSFNKLPFFYNIPWMTKTCEKTIQSIIDLEHNILTKLPIEVLSKSEISRIELLRNCWSQRFINHNIFTNEYSSFVLLYEICVVCNTQNTLTIIGLTLELYREKYGVLPETLDALVPEFIASVPVNPFDLQPFIYEMTDTEIIIRGGSGIDKTNGNNEITYSEWHAPRQRSK